MSATTRQVSELTLATMAYGDARVELSKQQARRRRTADGWAQLYAAEDQLAQAWAALQLLIDQVADA